MPMRPVIVRRWEVLAAFILLSLAYVIGLWALHRSQTLDRQGRAARLTEIHRADVQSCTSRHNLAVALLSENRALTLAEGTAIQQAERLKGIPGITPREFQQELANAKSLVRHLKKAGRLAHDADCAKPPPPLQQAKTPSPIP